MGDSLPPPAAVDLVGSFARLAGADAEIVLWEPQMDSLITTAVLRRRDNSVVGGVESLGDGDNRRLVARVPRAQLSNGIWSIAVRSESGQDEPIAARLLVQGRRPLVLLWGGITTPSHIPDPRPTAAKPTGSSKSARTHAPALPPLKRQIAAAGGRFLDRRIAVLPPERADKLRGAARRMARRIVS